MSTFEGKIWNIAEKIPLFALSFLLGIALLHQQPSLPDIYLVAPALVFILLVFRFIPRLLKLPLMVLCGFLWAALHAYWMNGLPLHPDLEGVNLDVIGVINGIPQQRERSVTFTFDVLHLQNMPDYAPPKRLRLSWYGPRPELATGETWQLTVRLRQPSGMQNPGGFDYERWLFQNGYTATGYVRSGEDNQRLDRPLAPYTLVDQLRAHLVFTLDEAMPNAQYGSIIMALAVGYRNQITQQQWETLIDTGTSHLMAISGLHVGLLAGLGYFLIFNLWRLLLTPLCLVLPAQRAGVLGALLLGFVYALLAGFAIPTQRALIMLVIALLAVWFGRTKQPLNTLSWALIAVLLWDPRAVLVPGFWLSFAAVLVIIYSFSMRVQPVTGMAMIWRIQWVSAVGLIPITILWFQHASLISPWANLIAVPWVSMVVVPLVLFATLLLQLHSGIGVLALQLAELSIAVLWPMLDWMAALPLSHAYFNAPLMAVILGLLGIIWLLAPNGIPSRWLGLIMLLPLLFPLKDLPAWGEFRFVLLDSGQGLASVVKTRHHTLVYDTGPRFSERFDVGRAAVVPYLRYAQRSSIDRLVISHGDNDHIGGAKSIIAMLNVAKVLSLEPAQLPHPYHVNCLKGQSWEWDGVLFETLHPPPGWRNDNESSCVLRVSGSGGSLLLTGDVESLGEAVMLRNHGQRLTSDVLLVAHHGARDSTGFAFLEMVNPEWALISAGYRNRFGHPHSETLERLHTIGAHVHDTITEGAIEVHFRPDAGVSVLPGYRIRNQRHYHRN